VFIVRHSDLIICKVEGFILKRAELSVRQPEKVELWECLKGGLK